MNQLPPNGDFETAEPRETFVGMDEWAAGGPGEALEFDGGLGPCIGVAVHDPLERRGHLGHFVSPSNLPDRLEEFLKSATGIDGQTRIDAGRLKVYVRGGALDPDFQELREATIADREFVSGALSHAGLSVDQIDLVWAQPDDAPGSMRLDCSTGNFSYDRDPDGR